MRNVVLFSDDANAQQQIQLGLNKSDYRLAADFSLKSDVVSVLETTPAEICVVYVDQRNSALLGQLKRVNQKQPMPMVMFVTRSDANFIDDIIEAGISALVVDGLDARRVTPILSTAIVRFNKFNAMRNELIKTKLSLEERKYVDCAKSMMVRYKGFSENDAHHTLRKMAMAKNKRIGQVAKDVIDILVVLDK